MHPLLLRRVCAAALRGTRGTLAEVGQAKPVEFVDERGALPDTPVLIAGILRITRLLRRARALLGRWRRAIAWPAAPCSGRPR